MTSQNAKKKSRHFVVPCNQAAFYVSPRGNDRWSGRLPETSAEGSDGPFATLERARDALRILRKEVGDARVARIHLRDGIHVLKEPLVLTSKDSGGEKYPVTFEAFRGERPILSGGQRIEGWSEGKVHGKPCWIASVPGVADGKWNFTQLFMNGVRRPRTRLPKEGYHRFTGIPKDVVCSKKHDQWGQGPNAALFAGREIRPWKNLSDVKLIALQLWFEMHHRLRSVDPVRHRVNFCAKSISNLKDEKFPGAYVRYFVENAFEALDTPGEWYLDRSAGRLYYLPLPGESLETIEAIAPKLSSLLRFEGTERQPVRHIHFENIAFHYAEWDYPPDDVGSIQAAFKVPGVVVFDRAEDCILYGCEIAHIAQYGVEMKTGCSGNRIIACNIHDMGAGGIRIGHEWLNRTDLTSPRPAKPRPGAKSMSAEVSDCRIHDGALIHFSAIGVWIGNAGHNRIFHNEIFDLNYTGISCGWTWGYAPTATLDNRIEYNHIHHINWKRVINDNGGIYTLGIQPGTVVRGNHIHHIGCYGYGGWGIYPDEGSSEILYENNVVHHTDEGGFFTNYGRDNLVRNNIFALSGKQPVHPGRLESHRSTVFEQNIVYWRGGGFPSQDWRLGHYLLRNNLFWNGGGPLDFGNGMTLSYWQKIGQHLGTLIADPLFVDPDAGDFALRKDSPALRLGFRPLDVSRAGPRLQGCRPLSFADWSSGRDTHHPIVRTCLECVGEKSIRIMVENVGSAPASGRLGLQATPTEQASLNSSALFVFRDLPPGKSKSAQFPIKIASGTDKIRVETLPLTRNVLPALQFFTLRDPEWRIPRLRSVSSTGVVYPVLAGLKPQILMAFSRTVAEFRAAMTGPDLALSARIIDADPKRGKHLWEGSCIELFLYDWKTRRTPAGIRQFFLVPAIGALPAKGACREGDGNHCFTRKIRVESTAADNGYKIAILLPSYLFRFKSPSRKIGIELVVHTTLRKGSNLLRFPLFDTKSSYQDGEGCAAMIVE